MDWKLWRAAMVKGNLLEKEIDESSASPEEKIRMRTLLRDFRLFVNDALPPPREQIEQAVGRAVRLQYLKARES